MKGKRVNVDIDVKGAGSVFVHKAVQQMLFDKGFVWGGSGAKLQEYGSQHPFYFKMNEDGSSKKMWKKVLRDTCNPTIKATNILSGAFDLDKWIKDSTEKETPKNIVYCADLTWVKGEAREVISEAIQKKAFEKGYRWSVADTTVQHKDKPGLFFDTRDNTVCFSYDFNVGKGSCSLVKSTILEISVNKALRGEYANAKKERK